MAQDNKLGVNLGIVWEIWISFWTISNVIKLLISKAYIQVIIIEIIMDFSLGGNNMEESKAMANKLEMDK